MKAILTGVSMALAITTAGAAEPNQYLCLMEGSGGLHYDAQVQSWRSQAFGTGRKYILRRINDTDRKGEYSIVFEQRPRANWAFFEFGKSFPTATCRDGVSEFLAGMFICEANIHDAAFDKDSLRFEMVSHGAYISQGYWEKVRWEEPNKNHTVDPSHPDDLFFEIGKCSPF